MPFRVLMETKTPDGVVFEKMGYRPLRTLQGAITSAMRVARKLRHRKAAISVWLVSGDDSYIRREMAWTVATDGSLRVHDDALSVPDSQELPVAPKPDRPGLVGH